MIPFQQSCVIPETVQLKSPINDRFQRQHITITTTKSESQAKLTASIVKINQNIKNKSSKECFGNCSLVHKCNQQRYSRKVKTTSTDMLPPLNPVDQLSQFYINRYMISFKSAIIILHLQT